MTRYFKFVSGLTLTVFLALGAWAENPDDVQTAIDTGSCPGCDLSSANLVSMLGIAGDFSSTSLNGANLYRANLSDADISGSDLTGADLTAANLAGANLTGAILTDVVTDEFTTCPDTTTGPCAF